MSIYQRNDVINKTKEYITENLALINESDFNEPIHIILARELNYFGGKIWGMVAPKGDGLPENMVISVYGPKHSSLKHELMQLITTAKWGEQKDNKLKWLSEGLAAYANADAFDCDGHNFEERYTYFLQNNKLFSPDTLLSFSIEEGMPHNKIAYNQCAYITGYLLRKYGVREMKDLWQNGMDSFEKIFGLTFEGLIIEINNNLSKKYSESIAFNWAAFNTDCFANQYDEWLPLNPLLYPGFEGMVSKVDGNIKYTVDSTRNISERNYIIEKIKKNIADNLEMISETGFDDFFHIILFKNRTHMAQLLGAERAPGGIAEYKGGYCPENLLYSVYGNEYNPLKHELMHMITFFKWGIERKTDFPWLNEGLAVFANPETFGCDGHSLEERYAYFMKSGKLQEWDSLFFSAKLPENKIAYGQAGYLVKYLYRNYGVEKIKLLWKSSLENFEEIYGLSFEKMIEKINDEINKKYPNRISFNWDDFNRNCDE
jgi:hypothetical protein